MPEPAAPHLRLWPYRDAPDAYRFPDNGGDEDWVAHIPTVLLNRQAAPDVRCPTHHPRVDLYDCQVCDDLHDQLLPVNGPPLHFDDLAIAGYDLYIVDDGAVVITNHA